MKNFLSIYSHTDTILGIQKKMANSLITGDRPLSGVQCPICFRGSVYTGARAWAPGHTADSFKLYDLHQVTQPLNWLFCSGKLR